MSTHAIVTLLAAAMVGFSAISVLVHAKWVVEPLADYGVPRTWWPWLGAAKAAGALGLLAGLAVPAIGVTAGVCLVLYFVGAVTTVLRARSFAHVPFPLLYAAPVVGSLAVGAA
ncbi:DoxX family protein [Nocardioides sp. TF02-7]|uniref:DoxX family protein n=1 Tax=Nocardioides sp. TF02-7 TaxID=2917724 RepID=UPI001F06AFC5|nr:DoxX family protein [Nocardioides sp. TF02-7]UMG91617.1 DoxX family protein [Nocardioides sp. TF02-7]